MNNLIVFFVGGLIGLVAAFLFNARGRKDLTMFTVIGAVGALVGGNLLAPYFGVTVTDQNLFSAGSLLAAAAGAVILITGFSLFRRPRLSR